MRLICWHCGQRRKGSKRPGGGKPRQMMLGLTGHTRNSPSPPALAQHAFSSFRPFFCQVNAVETAIWLTEVAPNLDREGRICLEHLANAHPELTRLALKLATGAGKTPVMALLIVWQTGNAVRHPQRRRFRR